MSTKPPKFSILLPTKNRSEIVEGAIESALKQTCPDFELIVSDNDDSPDATKSAVAKYTDSRIRYFRTSGKLAMHENWDYAFSHARGDYVIILEDKMRLIPNALDILSGQLEKHAGLPVSFKVQFAQEATLPALDREPRASRTASLDVIKWFCAFEQDFFEYTPKGLNSCVSRELLVRLKAASPSGFLYSPLNPDYAAGFMTLSAVEEIVVIREGLIYVPNNWMWQGKYSNGQASYKKTAQFQRYTKELPVSLDEIMALVPVKAPSFWINFVIYDYLTKCNPRGGRPPLDWSAYYSYCALLLLIGKKLGADMSEERKALMAALAREPWGIRCKALLGAGSRVGSLVGNKLFGGN